MYVIPQFFEQNTCIDSTSIGNVKNKERFFRSKRFKLQIRLKLLVKTFLVSKTG